MLSKFRAQYKPGLHCPISITIYKPSLLCFPSFTHSRYTNQAFAATVQHTKQNHLIIFQYKPTQCCSSRPIHGTTPLCAVDGTNQPCTVPVPPTPTTNPPHGVPVPRSVQTHLALSHSVRNTNQPCIVQIPRTVQTRLMLSRFHA